MSQAKYMKALRVKRMEAGLCGRCGKKLDTDKSFCRECVNYFNTKRKTTVKNTKPIRTLTRWEVTNRPLYNWMITNKVSVKDLAKLLSVSQRTVERWLFERSIPKELVKTMLENIVGFEII